MHLKTVGQRLVQWSRLVAVDVSEGVQVLKL